MLAGKTESGSVTHSCCPQSSEDLFWPAMVLCLCLLHTQGHKVSVSLKMLSFVWAQLVKFSSAGYRRLT